MRKIRITAGDVSASATLNDTKTAEAIWSALPIEARGSTWGDEIYFSIPVHLETERGQEVVELGDLGYWAPGAAFCIFFGPTPASRGSEIRPASEVTVFGRVDGDPKVFKKVPSGSRVRIEQAGRYSTSTFLGFRLAFSPDSSRRRTMASSTLSTRLRIASSCSRWAFIMCSRVPLGRRSMTLRPMLNGE